MSSVTRLEFATLRTPTIVTWAWPLCQRAVATRVAVAISRSANVARIISLRRAFTREAGSQMLNVSGQRRELAADDGPFVSVRIGWLPFARPLGSILSFFGIECD